MIAYCTICYFIMLGIMLDEHKDWETFTYTEFVSCVFAPIVVPIIFGMSINNKS